MSAIDYFSFDSRPDVDYGRDYQPGTVRDGRALDDVSLGTDALDCYSLGIDSFD